MRLDKGSDLLNFQLYTDYIGVFVTVFVGYEHETSRTTRQFCNEGLKITINSLAAKLVASVIF
jgi:hypothetical protein